MRAGPPPSQRRLIGSLLSFGIELGQYYDAGRVTTFTDFATNTIGTLLGGLAAIFIGPHLRLPFIGELGARPAPTLLVLAWLTYWLYPYVPTINLHKYWNALKPIVLTPALTGYDLFRQTAIWLTLYILTEAIVGRRRSALLAPLFVVGVLCARIAIVGTELRLAEPVGAAVALAIWLPLLLFSARLQAAITGIVLCAYVIAFRLEPFTFLPNAREFDWVPFLGMMHGALHINTLAFLEKFFLYGSTVYLLGAALGLRWLAALLTAAVLFTTSWAERWLPGRSGEVTDALIAVIAAVVFALLPRQGESGSAPQCRRLTARERRLRDWQQAQARALGVKPDR